MILNKSKTQKKYYQSKLEGIERMIWDLEFRRFQLRGLREEVRQQRDRVYENIDALTKQIEKGENKPETLTILTEEKNKKQKALEELEDQMVRLDNELSGRLPEMEPSVEARIDGCYDLLKQWKKFIKQNGE